MSAILCQLSCSGDIEQISQTAKIRAAMVYYHVFNIGSLDNAILAFLLA